MIFKFFLKILVKKGAYPKHNTKKLCNKSMKFYRISLFSAHPFCGTSLKKPKVIKEDLL